MDELLQALLGLMVAVGIAVALWYLFEVIRRI